ncbi:LysE/ArgO family amino acid transporter [Oceanicella sp. SM1341]|uniref:LysE/ArgO family amino acid transporter n=1 Tax=Oceanicella sp. SM1341 TaxID=1548889 RepID=UPI000E50853F|nr:LysE/ArgO family amino acid transporter [Oceanicella sp. SM1341]
MTTALLLAAALRGFLTGGSLILAIGAQNAFVLRQGLMRAHVFAVCLACALSDALLIAGGVAGFGAVVSAVPLLPLVMRWAGAAFLIVYGALRFRAALHPQVLEAGGGVPAALGPTLATCLTLTWANPHVYLDTFGLIGAVSTAYHGAWPKTAFGAGAVAASFAFFFALGYGARLLAPLMRRPASWRVLDILIGIVMWAIAAQLLLGH